MTYDELMRAILEVLPHATAGEDNDGQLIIYTDMRLSGDDVVPFEEDED